MNKKTYKGEERDTMRILVCVKQVPDPQKVRMEETTKRIDRRGDSMISPFDLYALEGVKTLRDAGVQVHATAVTMGPAQAVTALHDSYASGADDCLLLSDEAFAGADLRKTALVLQKAIEKMEEKDGPFDAIFCGAKSIDGGNSMLPAYLAQLLGRSHAAYALGCRMTGDGEALEILKENDLGNQVYRVPFPCVVSFTKNSQEPTYPLIERIITASSMDVPVLNAGDIFGDQQIPQAQTAVDSFEYRDMRRGSLIVNDKDQEEGARKLAKTLYDAHVL